MRFDFQNELSQNQAFTGVATVSTNSYAKQTALQDLSIGRRMALVVEPTVNAGAGSSLLLEAIQADDAALTTNVTSLGSITVAAAKFILGAEFEIPIPQGVMTQLYVGFRCTITGGTTTASMSVYFVPQDEMAVNTYFPKVVDALT